MVAIFNLSEDEISSDSFINFSLLLFRTVFLDFHSQKENANLRHKIVYIARNVIFKILLFSYGLGISSFVAYCVNADSFYEASGSIPNIATLSTLWIKVITTFLHKNDLQKIFVQLRNLFARRAEESKNHKVKGYLDTYHRVVKTYGATFLIGSLQNFVPIIPFFFYGTMSLSVKSWYPFDEHQPKNFIFAWVWINYIICSGLLLLLATDSLLYGLITVIVMEFDILNQDIKSIRFTPSHERQKKTESFVSRHNELLDICERLQNIYSFTFLIIFVITSMILCFVFFQISTASDIITAGFYISYAAVMGGQVLLLCFFGQKLTDASESINNGIYDCGWEDFNDHGYKKQFILVMIRAQKMTRLTAMKFVSISLESFTTVRNLMSTKKKSLFMSLSGLNNNGLIFYIAEKCLF